VSAALIVPAAGSGLRLGLDLPKALADVCGRALIFRTLERFAGIEDLEQVVVAVPADALSRFEDALAGLELPHCSLTVVEGGASRQESVRRALSAVRRAPEVVAVHDAARPLVSSETIRAVLDAGRAGAATVVSRPADSVRQALADGGTGGSRAVDRDELWLVGTPQAFPAELLAQAHEIARARGVQGSDDASLVEACTGATVALVERQELNVKVTHADDLELVRLIVADRLRRE